MQRARKRDVDAGWDGLLSFDEIIRFCVHYSLLDLEHEDRELLSSIRNRIAHSDKLLVNEHRDTRKLVRVRELCEKLLSVESESSFKAASTTASAI